MSDLATVPTTTPAAAPKQISQVDALKRTFTQMKDQFSAALPKHVSADKFTRVLMTALSTTPELVSADRNSLMVACMKAASDGLLPDGRESALVIFKTKDGVKVQYMPMIQGILKKVRNSGELASITSQIVFVNDEFSYWVDSDGEHIQHKPNMFGDRGDVLGVYALAKTKDGAIYLEVMTKQQVLAVKDSSKSKNFGPWAGAFEEEMWKKTVVRRLSKKLPMSTDMESFIRQGDEDHDFKKNDSPQIAAPTEVPQIESPKDVTETAPAVDNTKPSKLSQMITAQQKPVAEVAMGIQDETTN